MDSKLLHLLTDRGLIMALREALSLRHRPADHHKFVPSEGNKNVCAVCAWSRPSDTQTDPVCGHTHRDHVAKILWAADMAGEETEDAEANQPRIVGIGFSLRDLLAMSPAEMLASIFGPAPEETEAKG